MYKIIAFDIDGTILPYGDKEFSNEVHEMFAELKRKGYIVAFVTGREFVTIADLINTPNIDYFLGANGAFVYDMKTKENIFEKSVPFEDFKKIDDFCLENKINLSAITQKSVYFKEKECYKDDKFWKDFYNRIKVMDYEEISNEKIHQIIIRTSNSKIQKNIIDFANTIPGVSVNTIWDKGMFIGPEGVHKASGLEKLCEIENIKMSEIIAFGDGMNDKTMLKEVGMGIAMGIAKKEVREMANDGCDTATNFGTIKKLKEMNIL
ncbi:YcsE-related riboflavin metabolism phosphatase [Mycoplasma marinum]|uniref:Cof-type HAD-IIB family hydrolase n=1 Tax=Mycoplasma marinum TaxID=1937190 RepID=A0A4R0XT70_9MOLU|nr:HAD family hydrolase [Mycoplasma marinum]TCG10819.1 Cof-type HAD-IIB family hydrolase [Mycoplasma marinum]